MPVFKRAFNLPKFFKFILLGVLIIATSAVGILVFSQNQPTTAQAARGGVNQYSSFGLTVGDFSLYSSTERNGQIVGNSLSGARERSRLELSYYSNCPYGRQTIRTQRVSTRRFDDFDNAFRSNVPRNLDYNCDLAIEIVDDEENYIGSTSISPSNLIYDDRYLRDRISISAQLNNPTYDGKYVTIEGLAYDNFDPDKRVRLEFFDNPNIYERSNRLGSTSTNKNGEFKKRIRLDRLDSDYVYIYAKVEGWYAQLNQSPVRVNRYYVDPDDNQQRPHSSARNSMRQSTSRVNKSTQTEPSRQIQTLQNRYGDDVLAPYTDASNNYISLSYDSTLASLLQDHARKYNTQFGSREHMEKLRSQNILKEKSGNWYIDLSRLASRLD